MQQQGWLDLVRQIFMNGESPGVSVLGVVGGLVLACVYVVVRAISKAKRFRLVIEYDKTEQ